MEIRTEQEIDAPTVKRLRTQAGLTQSAFWTPIGVTQAAGCRYEKGNTMPKPIRILVYANYVAGLRLDASTKEGAERLMRLGLLQASDSAQEAAAIGAHMATAMAAVRKVNALLKTQA